MIELMDSCILDKGSITEIQSQPSENIFENSNFKGTAHHMDALGTFIFACNLSILTGQTAQGHVSFSATIK